MEQVKTQTTMADKLKRYTIMPLLAMNVLMGGLSSNAHADPLDAKQMDTATLSKTLLGARITESVSEDKKVEALKAFKADAKKQKLPKEITNLVTKGTILDHAWNDNTIMYMDNGTVILMAVAVLGERCGEYSGLVIRLYDIQPEHIAEPLPPISKGINTKTKKPYFSMPKKLYGQLSAEDKTFFKTLYKVMNTNFGTMMPMYSLDQKKINKNEYAGKLGDLAALFRGEIPSLEEGMDETEIKLRRRFGFILNGTIEMMKAGGKLSHPVGNCTGWTYHAIDLGDDNIDFPVFNGIYNAQGSLPVYRQHIFNAKVTMIRELHENFHSLMQENGVEPGTDIKQAGLTPKQQILAAWGNTFDNYVIDLFYKIKKYDKIRTLDTLLNKENIVPPKEIKEVPDANKPGAAMANVKNIYLTRLSCDYTK